MYLRVRVDVNRAVAIDVDLVTEQHEEDRRGDLESGRHLDQAIQLIEQAVRLRPNSGFFVDSLGWVHYRLGNYQLAVEFLEKATMLEPEDALIISHLGDAYWQTERYAEAQFKWRYAAQLADDEDLQAELQTKLASGLAATEQ